MPEGFEGCQVLLDRCDEAFASERGKACDTVHAEAGSAASQGHFPQLHAAAGGGGALQVLVRGLHFHVGLLRGFIGHLHVGLPFGVLGLRLHSAALRRPLLRSRELCHDVGLVQDEADDRLLRHLGILPVHQLRAAVLPAQVGEGGALVVGPHDDPGVPEVGVASFQLVQVRGRQELNPGLGAVQEHQAAAHAADGDGRVQVAALVHFAARLHEHLAVVLVPVLLHKALVEKLSLLVRLALTLGRHPGLLPEVLAAASGRDDGVHAVMYRREPRPHRVEDLSLAQLELLRVVQGVLGHLPVADALLAFLLQGGQLELLLGQLPALIAGPGAGAPGLDLELQSLDLPLLGRVLARHGSECCG